MWRIYTSDSWSWIWNFQPVVSPVSTSLILLPLFVDILSESEDQPFDLGLDSVAITLLNQRGDSDGPGLCLLVASIIWWVYWKGNNTTNFITSDRLPVSTFVFPRWSIGGRCVGCCKGHQLCEPERFDFCPDSFDSPQLRAVSCGRQPPRYWRQTSCVSFGRFRCKFFTSTILIAHIDCFNLLWWVACCLLTSSFPGLWRWPMSALPSVIQGMGETRGNVRNYVSWNSFRELRKFRNQWLSAFVSWLGFAAVSSVHKQHGFSRAKILLGALGPITRSRVCDLISDDADRPCSPAHRELWPQIIHWST